MLHDFDDLLNYNELLRNQGYKIINEGRLIARYIDIYSYSKPLVIILLAGVFGGKESNFLVSRSFIIVNFRI